MSVLPASGPPEPIEAQSLRRTFAPGLNLSTLCFGAMRLVPPRFDLKSATDLLLYLSDHGASAIHVSHEYESFGLTCAAVGAVRTLRPTGQREIIAKIGAPHFDEISFSASRFRKLIEDDLAVLGAERIDVVQWLVRHTPNEDAPRLEILRSCAEEVADIAARLKSEGKIGALAAFPYSPAFRDACLQIDAIEGVVDYLNLIETEPAGSLDRLEAGGRGFAAVRPLAAGKLAANAPDALGFPLLHPATATVIVSLSNRAQADVALAAVAKALPDRGRFFAMAARRL